MVKKTATNGDATLRETGFGIRDSGFGIRDSGFGIRDSGFGNMMLREGL
ncbi:AraC family transcriptional regulator [Vibrio campbellii]|nr:AraC family transcriptional regulator [Vibrio campbellii]